MSLKSRVLRILRLAISATIFTVDRIVVLARRLYNGRIPGRCVVLYYHGVPAAQCSGFIHQIYWLKENTVIVPADYSGILNDDTVYAALTFDDGFSNLIENALPVLIQERIPCTIFFPSGYLGRLATWYSDLAAPERRERVMTFEEIKNLPPDLITIGSHTVSHPRLTRLALKKAAEELEKSRRILARGIGTEVKLFSFPHGACNDEVIRLARHAGYERTFTIEPEFAFSQPDRFVTGRVRVTPDDWNLEFILKVKGAYRWQATFSDWRRTIRNAAWCKNLSKTKGRDVADEPA